MNGRLVLVRHGQSYGNVERRLDTRPPGSALTPLGRDQARAFRPPGPMRPGLVVHSVAVRAAQTAAEIGGRLRLPVRELTGLHEVQAGALENRNDDAAIAEFDAVYQRWHRGERELALPAGETANQVLERYLPILTELRTRYLDDADFTGDVVVVGHGAAIRLVSAVLAEVDVEFVLANRLANTASVVLAPAAGGRWSCVQWGSVSAAFGRVDGAVGPLVDPAQADPVG